MTALETPVYTSKYRQLIREFPLRPLRDRADAQAAARILDRHIRDLYDDEGEEAYVQVLAQLLEDYKRRHYSTPDAATGPDTLRQLMDELGLTERDVAELLSIGERTVAMILSGDRPITAEHAKRLGKRFAIGPAAFL